MTPTAAGLLVWRRWPDGSVRSQDLRQAAAELLGLEGTPWELVALTFHPQDEMVSIRSAADRPRSSSPSPCLSCWRPPAAGISCWPPPASREKILSLSVILFHLGPMRCSGRDWTWTGQGEQTILSRSSPMMTTAPRSPHCGGGRLGTGEVLTWEPPLHPGPPRRLPASFHPSGRQSVRPGP